MVMTSLSSNTYFLSCHVTRWYAMENQTYKSLGQASGAGADQVADCGIHRAIFFSRGHDAGSVKIEIWLILWAIDPRSAAIARKIEGPCGSPRILVKLDVSGPTRNIPYGVTLLDAQGSAVSAVPPQKKSAQIGHLTTDNRRQFGVRALGPRKGLKAGRGSEMSLTSYCQNFISGGKTQKRLNLLL